MKLEVSRKKFRNLTIISLILSGIAVYGTYSIAHDRGYSSGYDQGFDEGVNKTQSDFQEMWSEGDSAFVFYAQNLVDEEGVWHKVGMTFPDNGLSFACGINRESSWQINNFTTKYNDTRCSMTNKDLRDTWGDEEFENQKNLEAGRNNVSE